MKRGILLLVALLVAFPLLAFDAGKRPLSGIGVISARGDARYPGARAVRDVLPRYLVDELRHRGFEARELRASMRDLEDSPAERTSRYIVEIAYNDVAGGPVAAVETGGVIGDSGIGGEVSVIVADVAAELRVYDGDTLQLIDTSNLSSRRTAPALTAIGIGGRHAGLYL